jgi:hypothetical protein
LSWKFLTFTHRCDSRGLCHLLLSSKFFNHACRIGTSGKQVKNGLIDSGFLPDLLDLISDWLDKFSSKSIRDEHIRSNHGSILS